MRLIRSFLTLSPLKVSAGYFVFGIVWIPGTDVLLATFFQSQQMPTLLGILKGWIFIGLSSLLIYGLSTVHYQQMRTTQMKLETANQQLQVLHRVFRHNIRNDLNIIQGYTDIVSESISDTQSLSYLQTISQTTEKIINISEKLKMVENIDPTLSSGQAVDLVDLVESEIEKLSSSHPEITIMAELPDHAWIEGDESIRYAIREVLENAVIHTGKPDSECVISIFVGQSSDQIEVEIIDNGPGIPQEELQALHAEAETPLVHTSSIGLWLVTWLTRLHNGSVQFAAQDGTLVYFQFQPEAHIPLIDSGIITKI